jgi:hypothetical protein
MVHKSKKKCLEACGCFYRGVLQYGGGGTQAVVVARSLWQRAAEAWELRTAWQCRHCLKRYADVIMFWAGGTGGVKQTRRHCMTLK